MSKRKRKRVAFDLDEMKPSVRVVLIEGKVRFLLTFEAQEATLNIGTTMECFVKNMLLPMQNALEAVEKNPALMGVDLDQVRKVLAEREARKRLNEVLHD